MKTLFATIASALLATPMLFAQGELAPTDAPGPLMKSLDQIEPRIPISSLPYAISTSGSYYFTKNLEFTAGGGNAINISANNVTLDLGGFTLSSAAAVSGRAISIGSVSGVTVKNGYIVGNTTVTISGTPPSQTWTTAPAGFGYGINGTAISARYQELDISGCRFGGIFTSGGSNSVIDKVSVSANGADGISSQFGSISNCTATSNGGYGINAFSGRVSSSTAASNGGYGIYAIYGSVSSSAAISNGNYGIYASSGSISNSTARTNASAGIYADEGSVTGCTAASNGGQGISASSGSVTNSTALGNTGTDLVATTAVVAFCKTGTRTVTGSTLTGNLPTP